MNIFSTLRSICERLRILEASGGGGGGTGDVVGPASSTDWALVRWDGTTGKLVQDSSATLNNAGTLTVSGQVVGTGGVIGGDPLGDSVELTADGRMVFSDGTNTLTVVASNLIGDPLLDLTALGGAGGADTQIQFNDSGALSGVAGLAVNKTTGAVTQRQDALGTSPVAGFTVCNETAAASGAQQASPLSVWKGYGFASTGGVSQSVEIGGYLLPVQGTTAALGALVFRSRIAGGAWADIAHIRSGQGLWSAQLYFGTNNATPTAGSPANNFFYGDSFASILRAGSGVFEIQGNSGAAGSELRFYLGPRLRNRATNDLSQGAADAAAPASQTLSVQNVLTGTTNTSGVARCYDASRSTGTGTGGSHIFRGSPAGSSGSAQNALVNLLELLSTGACVIRDAPEPSTPATGYTALWLDAGSIKTKDSSGTVRTLTGT